VISYIPADFPPLSPRLDGVVHRKSLGTTLFFPPVGRCVFFVTGLAVRVGLLRLGDWHLPLSFPSSPFCCFLYLAVPLARVSRDPALSQPMSPQTPAPHNVDDPQLGTLPKNNWGGPTSGIAASSQQWATFPQVPTLIYVTSGPALTTDTCILPIKDLAAAPSC